MRQIISGILWYSNLIKCNISNSLRKCFAVTANIALKTKS